MCEIDFSNNSLKFHFIGIGGISMSGLAELLLSKGFKVSGSDSKETSLTQKLEKLGATIAIGQRAENITDDIDIVVMTAAIREDNPELKKARNDNKTIITRAVLLGLVMKQYKNAIAVSGTHGKTTTTSMVSELLMLAKLDPTLSIGGILPSIGGNFKIGAPDYFVTEACEYTNSFHSFFPSAEIILNVDADHLDFFKDLDDIRDSFKKFVSLIPDDGVLIINGEIKNAKYISDACKGKVITFGLSDGCNYQAKNISFDNFARPSYTLFVDGKESGQFSLGVSGEHNVLNSLSVIALARYYKISDDITKEALLKYTGTDRRFQYKGMLNGATIMDDYAHHPTEITATIEAAKQCGSNRLWVLFQPHTYTRTKALFNDFAKALSLADKVILADIYAARETDNLGISSSLLADEINKIKNCAIYLPDFDTIEEYIRKNLSPSDMLITMGAGNVVEIGDSLIAK